jgi:hypothetical protein
VRRRCSASRRFGQKRRSRVQKNFNAATIRQFEADAKAEGEKTIVGYLTAYSSPDPSPPICGGSVQGDVATLQTKDADGGVVIMRAVKENGEWKTRLVVCETAVALKIRHKYT